MAIKIELQPYCYKCTESDLEISTYGLDTTISCLNCRICKNAIKLSEEHEKGEETTNA